MRKPTWYIVETKAVNPLILGGLYKPNLFSTFLALINPSGCKTIKEARKVLIYAERRYKKEFLIVRKEGKWMEVEE